MMNGSVSRGREFPTEGAAVEKKSYLQMFWSQRVDCDKFLSQRRSVIVLMESTHKEDQTDKQELYQIKGSDKMLTSLVNASLDIQPS